MKKKFVSILLVLTLLVLTLGYSPQSALAAGQTFHFSSSGKGADAGWTTCPYYPEPNQVCTDTYFNIAEQMYKEDGTRFPSTTLFIDQYTYRIDKKGNYIFLSESYGYSDSASLSIDNKLTSATASAMVSLYTCTVDRRGNWNCSNGGTADVSAAWTGQGDLTRQNGNFHVVSKGFTINDHFQGTFRDATATGQMNGVDLGSLFYASMFNSKYSEVYICHGGC